MQKLFVRVTWSLIVLVGWGILAQAGVVPAFPGLDKALELLRWILVG